MSIFVDPPKKRAPKPIMPPAAIEACSRLRSEVRWRAGSDKQLDDAVRRSIEAYDAFAEKVYAVMSDMDEEVFMFMEWATPSLLRESSDFVVGWFMREWARVEKWSGWSGDLKAFVFSARSEKFHAFGHDIAAEYGDSGVWEKFVDRIKGAK